MEKLRIGYAFCGSFCTLDRAMAALLAVREQFDDVTPIFSENTAGTDTRFGAASDFVSRAEGICGKKAILTLAAAEPIGPKKLLDVLVVSPCTGNTLAKLAQGITDSVVTMAVKAHLRNARPVVLAVSTNDGLGVGGQNIGILLPRKNVYFVPFGQDDCVKKPTSLVADFGQIPAAIASAAKGEQLQPLLLR
ncbi:MAG: dipicolinate synthase subunit B [Oscillospiraceae bacterium]